MKKIIYYFGLDVHKESITICIAPNQGEIRQYGKIGGKLADMDRFIKKMRQAHPGVEWSRPLNWPEAPEDGDGSLTIKVV